MTTRFAPLALVLALVTGSSTRADEPLPKDARARLGFGELHVRTAQTHALLPPDYDLLLLPDTLTRYRLYDLKAGRFSKADVPVVAPEGSILISGDGTRIVTIPPEGRNDPGRLFVVRSAKTGFADAECHAPKGVNPTRTEFPYVTISADGKVLALAGRSGSGKDAKLEVVVWNLEKADENRLAVVAARVSPAHLTPTPRRWSRPGTAGCGPSTTSSGAAATWSNRRGMWT